MDVDPAISDEQLALRSSRGDRDAFAELYSRYFQGLYDLTFRMVRDRELAADLVQNCFISAWGSLQKRTVSGNVRAWLYAIARNTAINEIRRKKRWEAVVAREPSRDDSSSFEGIDTNRLSNPEDAFEAQELVNLVWESAAALGPKEYSLLDLHLRRDLAPGEIAASLGLPNSRVHVMLSRLKSSLEESVGIALLTRRGRRDCPQLNEILSSRDSLNRDVRMEVRRHMQECHLCEARRRRFVAPAEIFSAIALIPVSSGTETDIWSRISPLLVPGAAAIGGGAGAAGGRAARWWAQSGTGVKVATMGILGAVLAVPVGVSLLLATTGGGGDNGLSDGGGGPVGVARATVSSTKHPPETRTPHSSAPVIPTPVVAEVISSPEPTGTAGPTSTGPAAPTLAGALTPRPTPAPTKAQSPTPQPTPTPAPTTQADIVLFGMDVFVIGTPSAGLPFQLSATAHMRNDGGAVSALVDTTFALNAPADCVFSPPAPATVENTPLDIGANVDINRSWSVTCSAAGEHTLSVRASAAIDSSQSLTDPNPANNVGSGSDVVVVNP